jgi:hypothetical protein
LYTGSLAGYTDLGSGDYCGVNKCCGVILGLSATGFDQPEFVESVETSQTDAQ